MKPIHTEKAPKAVGPYSQAIVAGDFVFCSGQIPLVPDTGEMIVGGIIEQTKQVLENLKEVLIASGTELNAVASVNVYLKSMSVFKEMNQVYERVFGDHKPARVTIGVSELPKNSLVEISCVALLKK